MERRAPPAYPDGVYTAVPEYLRANAMLVSNISQYNISALASQRRTAFFVYFGKLFVCLQDKIEMVAERTR